MDGLTERNDALPAAPPGDRSATPVGAWIALIVLTFLYVVALLDRQVMTLLVEPIESSLHLSDTQMGAVQGLALYLFAGVAGIGIGWIADRSPRSLPWLVFGGMLIWSLSTAACGLARNFWDLFAARSLIGFGEAALAPAAAIILSTRFSRERLSLANGIYFVGSGISAGIVFTIGGAFIHSLNTMGGFDVPGLGRLAPWQASFILVGLPGLLLAFLAFALRSGAAAARPKTVAVARRGEQDLRSFLRQRGYLLAYHTIGYACIIMNAYALIAWAPSHLVRNFHLNIAQVGVVVGLSYGLAASVGNIASGLIIDWLYSKGVADAHYAYYRVTTLIGIPLVVLAFTTTNAAVCIVSICTVWAVSLAAGPLTAALQLFTPMELRGRVSQLSQFVSATLAIGATPFIIGVMNDQLFHDHKKVGLSISVFVTVFGAIAVIAMSLGRKHLARAVEEDVHDEAPHSLPQPVSAA